MLEPQNNHSNNKRIAKNTLFLYFRMLFMMAVTLYTSRIVLATLGIEDYGIYNVVGGVVIMFSFINSAMSTATQRYLSYELGTNNLDRLKTVFSISIIIHFAIAFIVLILAETVGLWFLENKLVIPENRMDAAFWVYQISIVSCMISIVSLPYNAAIIARERMSAFAYISIFEVVGKLLLVYLLVLIASDKLIFYAIFVCIVQIIIRIIYGWYCKKNFQETSFSFVWDKKLFSTMMSFSGWNMFGCIAGVCLTQGTDILLNLFFGPVVNAAKGISTQVQAAINSFCANFQTAINPQIVKSYASNNMTYVHNLLFTSSRLSFYLVLLFSIPIMLETNQILHLWLKDVPNYSALFVQLSMVISLSGALSNTLIMANGATGDVRKLMTTVGLLFWSVIPLSYVWLKLGGEPPVVFFVQIGLLMIAHIIRLKIVGKQLAFSFLDYCRKVLFQIVLVLIICFIPPYVLKTNMDESWLRLVLVTIISTISVLVTVFFVGITTEERNLAKNFIVNKFKKIRK
ncbi:MAG: oligosaccharide flippase family protein [Candidatus Symbiothrix sp.]|jgi:O-antigen/teichoic acid export membrane protein|nr:oligosaccharide flippase family protein [Candidatus Symbiothrix sp.]